MRVVDESLEAIKNVYQKSQDWIIVRVKKEYSAYQDLSIVVGEKDSYCVGEEVY
jgi:hypothetical protein